ncbi:MAG: GDSL-type esterase/lipase family protein [bacterium]|nr:GDSL-type esterase/lipase family protein [bacterium]
MKRQSAFKTFLFFTGLLVITVVIAYYFSHRSPRTATPTQLETSEDTVAASQPSPTVSKRPQKGPKSTSKPLPYVEGRKLHPTTHVHDYAIQSPHGLITLFQALKNSQKDQKTYRIAYYGDSMIEGDLITQDFRKSWQERFGGNGVGYVPLATAVELLQWTVRLKNSENWLVQTVVQKNEDYSKLGIAGMIARPISKKRSNANAFYWVEWFGSQSNPYYQSFQEVSLWYASTEPVKISCGFSKDSLNEVTLYSKDMPSIHTLVAPTPQNRYFRLETKENPNVVFYGVSLENGKGWYIDNFSLRGAGGWELAHLPTERVHQLSYLLNYQAVLLEFGANVFSPRGGDYHWYFRKLTAAIDTLKRCFPQATIILISNPDRCHKTPGGYEADENVPLLIQTQQRCAEKTQIVFWNLYEAMGGKGSSIQMQEKRWIAKDHVHLSPQGGKFIANLLLEDLMKEYEIWLQYE